MDGTFELFDHTADMGIKVRSATREGLIAPAMQGLYAAFGELVSADGETSAFEFSKSGDDDSILLRDFLTELLILFERDHKMLCDVSSIQFPPGSLKISGKASNVDPERSAFAREVKAVTYHELALRQIDGGYEATFIVDI